MLLAPEIGTSEILIIAAIALIVVGPKDLPVLLRRFGQFVGRMRSMASDFRASFEDMARQSELADLRKEVEAMRSAAADTVSLENNALAQHLDPSFGDYVEGAQTEHIDFDTPPPPPEPVKAKPVRKRAKPAATARAATKPATAAKAAAKPRTTPAKSRKTPPKDIVT
jgi:sec-independent protein translocase protein TatB